MYELDRGKKYCFLRLCHSVFDDGIFLTRNIVKRGTKIASVPIHKKGVENFYTHISLNLNLLDSFLGLNYDAKNPNALKVESLVKPTSDSFVPELDYENSKFMVLAYPMKNESLIKLEKLLKDHFINNKITYGVDKFLQVGLNSIQRKLNKKTSNEKYSFNPFEKDSYVCSTYIAALFNEVSEEFRNYLDKTKMKAVYFSPNDFYSVEGMKILFKGYHRDYDNCLKKFLNNKTSEPFKKYLTPIKWVENFLNKNSRVDPVIYRMNLKKTSEEPKKTIKYNNLGVNKMTKSIEEKNVIDLSKPAMLSVEELPANLAQLMIVDEKNRVIESTLMVLDAISRNNAQYAGDDFEKALKECTWIEEMRRNGKWMGEFEHPPKNESIERFMTVKPDRVSHRIRKWWREGNKIKGKVDFSVKPLGDQAWNWIVTGSNPSFSVRVYTQNYVEKSTPSGKKYLLKMGKMIPVTFDFVTIPGFYEAYAADPDKYNIEDWKTFNKTRKKVSSNSFESWSFDFTKENFRELVLAQESVPLLQEAYKIDLESADMIYTKDGLLIINPIEKGFENKQIIVPASTFELNQVLLATSNESLKRANKDLKTKAFAYFDNLNSTENLDADVNRAKEFEMSAEDFVKVEKKISREEFDNILPEIKKQISSAASYFINNNLELFDEKFTDSTLKRMNEALHKKKRSMVTKEQVKDSLLNCFEPVKCLENLNAIGDSPNSIKYIDILNINGRDNESGIMWIKRNLKESIEKTREQLKEEFGDNCLIQLFKKGDFSMENSSYDKSIQVKVDLRVV